MSASPRGCPAASPGPGPSCPERPGCPAAPGAALLPRDGAERAVMLALRYVAAAAETGDAACFDAAFDGAEAAFGPRDGALLVARAAALVRALRREAAAEGCGLHFLPPPCRHLSAGEAHLLLALRSRLSGERGAGPAALSGATRAALADLAVPVRAVSLGLPVLPAEAGTAAHP
ncbi:hypothetical protein [Lichenibacterium dinghuense]|uniref:hypothetical protein n=1 Tax=Lichenibacterium dinghuense TaxID=2895977 RepID=UPI001F19167E|nr:hypothetical protein [Lichenibacterium sp. 6Y81]